VKEIRGENGEPLALVTSIANPLPHLTRFRTVVQNLNLGCDWPFVKKYVKPVWEINTTVS
jgi:hypothetical protein